MFYSVFPYYLTQWWEHIKLEQHSFLCSQCKWTEGLQSQWQHQRCLQLNQFHTPPYLLHFYSWRLFIIIIHVHLRIFSVLVIFSAQYKMSNQLVTCWFFSYNKRLTNNLLHTLEHRYIMFIFGSNAYPTFSLLNCTLYDLTATVPSAKRIVKRPAVATYPYQGINSKKQYSSLCKESICS